MKKWKIKDIVDDPNWQKVRESLVGNWTKKPNECCLKLRVYLDKSNLTRTRDERLIILRNYLTGTAFRIGVVSHPCVKKLRLEVSTEIKDRQSKGIFTIQVIQNR